MDRSIRTLHIFDNVTILASGDTDFEIDLNAYAPADAYSLQVEVTGDGTVKFEYLMSNNKVDFLNPVGSSDIFSALTKISGTGGKIFDSFTPEPGEKMKIKASETGGASDVIVSAWLVIQ